MIKTRRIRRILATALCVGMLVEGWLPLARIATPPIQAQAAVKDSQRATIESCLYNAEYYEKANDDVAVALNYDDDAMYQHWLNYGMAEGRNASMVFNAKYYLEKNPDVAAVVGEDYVAAYEHFVTAGLLEGRESSPVFSVKYYLEANTDVAAAFNGDYVSAAKHFNENAIKEGRSGSGNFDYTVYRSCNKDVEELYGEYIEGYYIHYINHGRAEGRTGGLAADGSGSTGSESGGTTGGSTVIDVTAPSYRIFDADYYLEQYPALETSVGTDADTLYKYWMNEGIALGQTASPVIVPEEYLELNQDVAEAFGDDHAAAINHFLNAGIVEGRTGSYEFDYTIYVACNTDVTAEFGGENKVDYYFHYVKYGKAEDRTAAVYVPEAPEVEAEDWKTVLRELHSLETYAEREAYVAKLDKSVYKVEKTENFDLINKCNSGEFEISKEILAGYKLISESTGETVAEYTDDTLPEDYGDAAYFEQTIEHAEYGVCYFERVYTYETNTVNAKAALDVFVPKHFDTLGNYDEVEKPAYLMTLTNIATGETDPWGVVGDETIFDYDTFERVPIALTFERVVHDYNWCVGQLPDGEWATEQELYWYVQENGPVHPIETWDTLKYYEDLEHTTPAKFWW